MTCSQINGQNTTSINQASNGVERGGVTNGFSKPAVNGHVHPSLNGSQEGEFRVRCRGALEQWKKSVDHVFERCDLSGLAKDGTKYQLASTGFSELNLTEKQQTLSLTVPDQVCASLRELCIQRSTSRQNVVLFAVHQMLKVFGNGSHTVTASIKSEDGSSWEAFPTIVSHENRAELSVRDAIEQINASHASQTKMNGDYSHVNLTTTPGEMVKMGLFDLLVVFADKNRVTTTQLLHTLDLLPLTLMVHEKEAHNLQLTFRFSTSLFDEDTIRNFTDALAILLAEAAAGREETPVAGIELLSSEQIQQLEAWNNTDGDYPSSKRLHHLVEESVERCGNKVAVVCEERELTYAELNLQANRLARYICSIGIQPEQLVALFLDKNERLIVTILGIWKSGAAYVPIDPAYPDDRVRFVLDDTNARVVVASECHTERLRKQIAGDRQLQIISLEPLLRTLAHDPAYQDAQNLDHLPLTSKQLAYVTYTSGTTGFPKGIFKEHTSVVNSITDLSSRYDVAGQHHEAILLFSAYVFEPFVRQMLMALVNGHLLAIISDVDKYDADKLIPFMQRYQITYLNGTASVLQEYDFSDCPSLKRMILVGENLTDARYRALRRRFKKRILNEYGFTESAFVTALNIFEPDSVRENTSLGRPVRNVKCYILNPDLKRVPIGVTGELHIGGLGISRGYMNRPELTSLKFIPNPFQTERERNLGINSLMYKTGDLARWLPNGEVEYLGRADFQIKLRGIRIEPGEIESTLAMYPGVRTSLVVSRKLRNGNEETANEHLVGYYVCEDDAKHVPEADLLAFLETKLPRYMIPTRLVQLSQIPVTINGKADLRALPVVDISKPKATGTATASSDLHDQIEVDLRRIWSDVLGAREETISRHDSFFRLGGHSITCIQLIARIRQRLSASISIEDVFATRTLAQMADLVREKRRKVDDDRVNRSGSTAPEPSERPLPPVLADTDDIFLANSLQQGFVYHYLKHNKGSSETYIMQSLLRYNTALNSDVFQKAWKYAQQTFPAMRLRFLWEKEVFQVIDQDQPLDWRFLDYTKLPEGATEEDQRLEDLKTQDRMEPYKLDAGNLFRVYLIRHSAARYTCLFSCHHAILDGWSLPLLFEHVHEAYLQLLHGNSSVNAPIDEAYASSQRWLQAHREDHLEFWSNVVEQITERCDMNVLLNEKSRYKVPLANYDQVQDQREKTLTLTGDSQLETLRKACSEHGITLHSILQFVWHVVLRAYGGGSHTITGTTISGRNLPVAGVERSIGLYINTLPLVLDHSAYKNKSIMEAIADVQAKVNAMNTRGNVELGRLHKNDLKHGLFDTLFVLENYPNLDKSRAKQHQQELRYSIQGNTEKLDYPLAVIAREVETDNKVDGFTFTICYASELFEDSIISELLSMVKDTLKQIARNLDQPVRSLEYLSSSQLEQLAKWNATEAEFPDKTLHELFEAEASRVPNKAAVIYEDVTLTYRELNERANRMAHQLKAQVGPKPNDLIALIMDKSEHMMVSIIAVWKTGGAYVPIDPAYPEDRIRYILEDTRAIAAITDPCHLPRVEQIITGLSVPIYRSDLAVMPGSSEWSEANPAPSSTSRDLAYIIYTSGTTGRPKGVMVEHHGVVNLQVSLAKIFGLRETDDEVILSFSNYVFDHFVEQMTDALLNGQTLLVLNDAMRGDKERLYRYIKKNRVTYLSGTPSVISMYEFSLFKEHLRRVDCVGEAFSEPVFDKIRETFHGLVINGYGPTEVSITTHKRLYPFPERRTDKSIGRQVHNSTSYVLDEDMKRVPIGAVGELYLGGQGVARGYHNRPDLTAERFPPNPFQTEEEKRQGRNARLYRTGDIVRWIPGSNGELEYLGRNDFQVKIRGLRIELGEIEAVLSSYPEIKQSVVVAKDRKEGGQKFLVGYYVADTALSSSSIRRFLQSRLPDYMVPSRLIPINKLPVTPSGKLDTRALPPADKESDTDTVAPRSEIERILCEIWAELLDLPPEEISIYSDFFGLGGDSLKSTKLSFMIREAFNRPITVSELFRHRTIEALARLIVNGAGNAQEIARIADIRHGQMIPLSPAQERLLFLHEFEDGNTNAYNICKTLQIRGPSADPSTLEKALRLVLSRHEALRTLLLRDPVTGIYGQNILSEDAAQAMFLVDKSAVQTLDHLDQEISRVSQHVFGLGKELPLRAYIYSVDGDSSLYLTVVVHHANFDGWSWNVFRRDLEAFYSVVCPEMPQNAANLPKLKVQYKEYAYHHRQQLSSNGRLQTLSQFWLRKLDDLDPLHLIPDRRRPARFEYDGDDVSFDLSREDMERLQIVARDCKATLYAVLLSAYCLMLASYTNQTDIPVGIPVTHRTHPEFESVVGFFVNLLVLRVDVSHSAVRELVEKVMREMVDAQLHQDMPFQEVTKLLQVDNDPSRHPLIQTVFNYEASQQEGEASEQAVRFSEYQPAQQEYSAAKFDLSATVIELESGGLRVNFNYATSLFSKNTIVGFLRTYEHLIYQLSRVGSGDISKDAQLSLVPPAQNRASHLPLAQSRLAATPPAEEEKKADVLNKAFEHEAALAADKIAIVHGDQMITYRDLNDQANQLARYMLSIAPLKADDQVALMLDKSIDMVICILAVWKAGAAYVPLDPTYPSERIDLILQETQAKVVLANSKYASRCDLRDAKVIEIDSAASREAISRQSKANVESNVQSNNLAYTIFTSGTTGKPKGVLVEQNGVLRLRDALRERYFGIDHRKSDHGVLFLSNYVFDFSVEQFVLSVLSGQKMIIPPEDFLAKDEFYQVSNAHGLSFLSGTPSLLQQIDLARLQHLKIVVAAGEEFHASQYEKMRRTFRGPIYNAYGITETTVYNIITEFAPDAPYENALRELLPGTRAYLLGKELQPVPFDAVGELYLAGDCVARGYLNQPALTGQRFIPNPFSSEETAAGCFPRLYKTGDLARCRLNGNGQPQLEYMGRSDLQVKLRGFRIELSEVRDVLASSPGIKDCAVIAKYDSNSPHSRTAQYLVGYYTTTSESEKLVLETEIINFMKTKLPAYMIPTHLCRLEGSLPVTVNGKLDVRRLPDVDNGSPQSSRTYSPPRNVLQAKLCRLWSSTLGVERCGIDDDLFKLGGDSIMSLHLVAQIHRQLGRKVTVRDIFEQRTVRALCDNVLMRDDSLSNTVHEFRTEQGPVTGEAPLLPIQEWFLSKRLQKPGYWNHIFYIRTPELDVARLEDAVRRLQQHHDAFRMRLEQRNDGSYIQSFRQDCRDVSLRVLNLRNVKGGRAEVNQVLDQWQSGFDLRDGPIGAIGYLHGYDDGSARVWFSIHHLVVDTVSWQILARDLQTLYHNGSLGAKGSSVRQWAEAMQSYQASQSERDYWEDLMSRTASSNTALPALLIDGSRIQLKRTVDADKTSTLLRGQAGRVDELILAAVGLALQEVAPSGSNMVTIEGHGREEGVDPTLDVSRTMGWFTSMYPFEIPRVECQALLQAVANISDRLKRVPNNGVGYGALYGYVRYPLPLVSVNYLGHLAARTASNPNEWALAVGNGEFEYGLTCSPEDKDKSSSVVDVTAACVDGKITIDISSGWSLADSERFVSAIEDGLDSIFDELVANHQATSSSSGPIPTPQLFTEETFTPYFEYRDSSRQGPILFLLPPGEGGAESYFNNLVKQLPRSNLVTFNNYYLHSKSLRTFEELADLYIGYIRNIQPHGPYHLLGWSFGGILAMEIAQRLASDNEKISSLAFIDTYFDVRGTTRRAGLGDTEVLDSIYHIYDPEPERFDTVRSRTDQVVLFKAMKPNDRYETEAQRRLYEYYDQTPLNELDKLLPCEMVQLVPLADDTHFSWVNNAKQVDAMCEVIRGILSRA
ncbi:hypothetical protein VTO42DRAFT_7110 [Malbranchea cinnamomea]